jgi:flagellar motor component MotA
MISSFVDLQSLGLFIIISGLFMIATFRFNFKLMQKYPEKISAIFLVAGIIVGFSDLILVLQNRESGIWNSENAEIAKHMSGVLLAPFYGIVFASVTWFGSGFNDNKAE